MCLEAGQPGRGASWDVCSHLSFWKRVAGIVFCLAVIFILIGVILYSPRLLDLEPCPDDWLYYKRKCYYQSGSVADWNSSQKFCSDFGASLAVIDHAQDLEFILYRMRTIDFWIGLQKTENKFLWVNGESLNTNLFHVNITDDGDCVHINSAFVSTKKCSSQRNWLCTLGQFDPKTIS
ncbi:C-type lectin domain family 2 member L-like [Cygnus olor]|uniref:C-type lectin domain family 2 member L-like n=1 Tax=Cygnus olor TaxID=8869 RepID=UPI001ADE11CA|nr:C-type lectin domain family 2 member L-like [Cygnus olor]